MDSTLVDFVKALRTAEIKVSPAETLDAMECLDLVGFKDRDFLKDSLALVLSKTPEEKESFSSCFDRFFAFENFKQIGQDGEYTHDAGDDDADLDSDDDQASGEGSQPGSGNGEGGGASGEASDESDPNELLDTSLDPESPLGQLLLSGSRTELVVSMAEAGRSAEVNKIVVFTQKGLYTRKIMDGMGLKGLQDEIGSLQANEREGAEALPQNHLAKRLTKARDHLREQVRDYVEKQFFLHADETGKELREELLKKVKLSNLEKRNFKDVQEIVFKMAKKLVAIHSKRRKTYKRGQLDVRKTLRRNMQYDGMLFDLHWKAHKVDRPKVMCICDVSGSVSNYSRFLLMFLYGLADVIPKVRSFAFSSDLGEVTSLFQNSKVEEAMARTMRDYGNGSTDYGRMFMDFKNHCMDDVDNKTTIIILGDARNNFGDAKAEILREMYDKSKRVIWLNPEPKTSWTVGDAEMGKYRPACHQAEVCNSLTHLERVVSNLLKTAS